MQKIQLQTVMDLLSKLKEGGELTYLEAKNSLALKEKIGRTISAVCNSASFCDQDYGYIIWGVQDASWEILGTKFDLELERQGRAGFIYPQILQAFNYCPEIILGSFIIEDRRVYILRVKNCGDRALSFDGIPYIRSGEVVDELEDHPAAQKYIYNKKVDWSSEIPEGSCMDWLDRSAVSFLREKYFETHPNESGSITDAQLLNRLSLVNDDGQPNAACVLFVGKADVAKAFFQDRCKITWVYRDELNNIEERLSVEEEGLPFILAIPNILDRVNKFNTTLQDIDLFRKDILQYDAKVIEELLINAVAHRDWNINFWVEVVQTPGSLEFRNPGRFRANLAEVLSMNKRPAYLNPVLADFLKKMQLMEKEGGGLIKAFSAQIKKGLSIKHRFSNDAKNPRVDFILSGRVSDVDFARFVFASSSLSSDQMIILDRIHSGRNILNKDITPEEYSSVQDLVSKTGRGGVSLKVKEHLLKKSKNYLDSFSNTHASSGTSKEIILDYARKNDEFSIEEIYNVMKGKTPEWVRASLVRMTKEGLLIRVKRGRYSSLK